MKVHGDKKHLEIKINIYGEYSVLFAWSLKEL